MDSPLPPNPYKALNVAQDAPLATIRSAHRKLVLTCHPDKFQDEAVKVKKQEQFHEVQQAYEILSDETKRQRYDERVKLAELRAEMMKEKGGSRLPQEYGSRVVPEFSSRFEVRGDRVYEERVPSRYEEDFLSNNFQERRPVPKRYEERSPPASRRSSARISEERRRTRDDDDRSEYVYARQSAKAAEKSTKHSQEKRKDKNKRKDREAKFTSNSPYMDDYDSDSDATERAYAKVTPKHRHDDARRRDRDEPRRSNRRENSDHFVKLDKQTQSVEDYIKQKRDAAPIEIEIRRPAPTSRNISTADFETRSPHSSAPPMTPGDSNRRSSGRTRDARKVSPDRPARRVTEIVDPPRRPSMPSMPGFSSDPRPLKHMKESLRASTMSSIPEGRHSMRRSDTTPISQGPRRAETVPIKPKSKFSETHDSGYSSPDTPEPYSAAIPPLRRRTTYQISQDNEDPKRRNVIYVEPEVPRDRDRDRDPHRDRERDLSPIRRRQTDRPVMAARPSSNARASLSHANTFSPESVPSSRAPSFARTESSRVPPMQTRQPSRGSHQLYGEFVEPYQIVHESPKIRSSDISYSRRSPEEANRDAYPGSHFEPRHRPNLARNEKAY